MKWNNTQAYEYVMQLGDEGRINQNQVDGILKAAGIDENKALKALDKTNKSKIAAFGLIGRK